MAGSLVGQILNGEYTKTAASTEATKSNTTTSTSKTEGKNGTEYNEEMFLQLLVAEMQYQDPLEPTDNGEYVSQLASFSQIEAIQAVQDGMDNIESNSLVGKYAVLNVDGSEVSGRIDYVTKDDDKGLMVSIDGNLYEKSKIESVVDETYYTAIYMANMLTDEIAKLPEAEEVTVLDGEKIGTAISYYNSMDAYGLSFVKDTDLKKYFSVVEQYEKLMKAKEDADNKNVGTSTDSTAGTEEV